MTEYEAWSHFAATWGLLYFFALFMGVVIYAYWPRNKEKFDAAAQIPLRDGPNDAVTEPRA